MYTKHSIQVNNERVAYFEYPTQKELKGIILFCHGFPGTWRLTTMAPQLNEHGYTLEEINYRGDQDSDGAFSFLGSVQDVETLAKHLKQQYPNVPLTALGYSAGGFYVLCSIRKNPDLFDNIVLLNSLLDVSFTQTPIMEDLWADAQQTIRLKDKEFYQAEINKMNELFNPIKFVSELTPRISIIQSASDELLPIEVVKDFFGKLQNPEELIWIPDAGHALRGDEKELINVLIK
ncbi:lysophospholipase [Patescibacteria group bacterium]|nr:lysophospholipase [Patescibacteria group bacterium]MBU0964612.1 lysophospholipase [Patescibacteria group bacterium]